MIKQSKAKIFLADERGLNETESFRCFNTFNFGNYFNEYKSAFGDLYVLSDDTLDGGKSLSMLVEEKSYVTLLPVVGGISYADSSGYDKLVAAGQALIVLHDEGSEFKISNPFKDELVNYLQVWLRADENDSIKLFLSTYRNVNDNLNNIVPVFWDAKKTFSPFYSMSIGKFSGRGETVYKKKYVNTEIFIYVLEGAFEVEGRLLHARDGLALWNTEEAELEALSNDAIILLTEINFNHPQNENGLQ
jgi:redox-sensitive bicupin YhaK (pirin superfamily)